MAVTVCEAFPDYPVADFPADLPTHWQNQSWHNDAMPFFVVPDKHLGVWMDYKDPDMRENGPDWPRFLVEQLDNDDCHTNDVPMLLTTNDWPLVLALVQCHGGPPMLDLLQKLGADAKPVSDDDWGTERQIAAENLFFEKVQAFGIDTQQWETSKSGSEGMIDEALQQATTKHIIAVSNADLAALCDEYTAWNKAQGLDLGSADEHMFDEDLTEEQRAWVRDFSERWEDVSIYYGRDGVSTRKRDRERLDALVAGKAVQ